jgi:tripeptide aminopeptidase
LYLAILAATLLLQQQPLTCAPHDTNCKEVAAVAADRRVQRALSYLEQSDASAQRELIALTQIPAPPFKESERARRYAELLRAAGADSVDIDAAGNVVAIRRGIRRTRTVAIAGHMDTVFPEGTDVHVRQRGDTLFAPGVGDNSRGLMVLLQILRSMVRTNLRTDADLWFVGTVGEEGLGDLRGAKYLFRAGAPRIDSFIAVDGADDETITNGAVGSKRYRVTYGGAGGHSWGDFGAGNPIHALGHAIALFDDAAERFTAFGPTTTYNVGRIGGGTSVNAIPTQAWAEVDLRSVNSARLDGLDSLFHVAVADALVAENQHRSNGPELTLQAALVGERPSGLTASSLPLVQRALAATRAIGLTPRLDESSTDANVAIAHGIPAVTLGRGGISGNAHSPDEWWLNSNGTRGIRHVLFLILAEAGLPAH